LFTWLRAQGHAQRTDSWLAPILPMRHTEQSDRVANTDRVTADSKPQNPVTASHSPLR